MNERIMPSEQKTLKEARNTEEQKVEPCCTGQDVFGPAPHKVVNAETHGRFCESIKE